jgi:hypothetical protein
MLAGKKHGVALVVLATTLGMANQSNAETPSDGGWLLGVESGRYAPLGVIGATVSYAVTPRLSLGAGLGVGFAYEESYERPYMAFALSGKYYLYQEGSLRLGLSAGYSVEERVVADTLHRPNRPAETIEWRTPYGGGRYNGSLFAEWRRGTFVATGSLGLYRALTSPDCFYNNGLNTYDLPCESALGFAVNEPSLWQGWASVGVGWAPRESSAEKDEPERRLASDPAIDRVVFAPTANTLPKGAVSIRNTSLSYSEIVYGLSDNLQLTAFGISSLLVGVEDDYTTVKRSYLPVFRGLSFKARLPPRPAQLTHLAWVTYAGTGTFFDFEDVSIVQTGPVLSRCFTADCQSVISMHMLFGSVEFDPYYSRSGKEGSFGLSGRFRFTDHLGLALEAHLGPISPMTAATFRFMTRSWFLDVGAFVSLYPSFGAPIVTLGWTSF